MKTFIALAIVLLQSFVVLGQIDSMQQISFNTEVTLATRNIWRGLDYGSSPSIQGTLSVSKGMFEVGAWGTTTLNGSKNGYGTWMELFATFTYNRFSFTIDDYFFFNADDNENNYFDWNRNKTQHFVEGRIKYEADKFSAMAGYAFYNNKFDNTRGVYLEAEYFPIKDLSIVVGGLTSASWLSFYDAGGITTIGVSGRREIKVAEDFSISLKASLLANPSYDKSVKAEGVGTNPIYFVVYLTF